MSFTEAFDMLQTDPEIDGLGFVLTPPSGERSDLIEIPYEKLNRFRGKLAPDLEAVFPKLKELEPAGVVLFGARKWVEPILAE